MAAKNRVSAKQRLELVREALHRLGTTRGENEDYSEFEAAVQAALYGQLTPKSLADESGGA